MMHDVDLLPLYTLVPMCVCIHRMISSDNTHKLKFVPTGFFFLSHVVPVNTENELFGPREN